MFSQGVGEVLSGALTTDKETFMLTKEEFKKGWEENSELELLPIPPHVIDSLRIPEDAKEFLAYVGVPELFLLGYPPDVNLPRLPNSFPGTENLPDSYNRYRVFGDVNADMYVCIDEMEQGRIVYVIITSKGPRVMFGNSSYQHMAECWRIRGKYAVIVETKEVWNDDTLRNKYADMYEEEIRRVDPATFTEETSIWHERIQRIREGRVE
jgi:hypothetical protein